MRSHHGYKCGLGNVECIAQHPGDLGHRMQAAADRAFSRGAKRVVIIGTDCPSLDEPTLAEAFDALTKNDVVYGPAAETTLAAGESVSVIIPTLNEEKHLPLLLEHLKRDAPHEIIIADGGSRDRTVKIAEQAGARVVHSAKGRASQMNLAAATATGEFLLFLHADTLPPPDYSSIVRSILRTPGTSAGAFGFALSGKLSSAPLIERLVNLRCRLFQTPYGDQGLFLRRRIFRHAGRFPDWPVLEDLHLVRMLKRVGRVQTSTEVARTSPRRWQTGGTTRTFLRHQLMLAAYHIGVPVRHIARLRP